MTICLSVSIHTVMHIVRMCVCYVSIPIRLQTEVVKHSGMIVVEMML